MTIIAFSLPFQKYVFGMSNINQSNHADNLIIMMMRKLKSFCADQIQLGIMAKKANLNRRKQSKKMKMTGKKMKYPNQFVKWYWWQIWQKSRSVLCLKTFLIIDSSPLCDILSFKHFFIFIFPSVDHIPDAWHTHTNIHRKQANKDIYRSTDQPSDTSGNYHYRHHRLCNWWNCRRQHHQQQSWPPHHHQNNEKRSKAKCLFCFGKLIPSMMMIRQTLIVMNGKTTNQNIDDDWKEKNRAVKVQSIQTNEKTWMKSNFL